jgi:hypothetical protein
MPIHFHIGWSIRILTVTLVAGCGRSSSDVTILGAPTAPSKTHTDTWLLVQTSPSYPVPRRPLDDAYKIHLLSNGTATRTKDGIDAGRTELSEADVSVIRGLVREAQLDRDHAVPMHVELVEVNVYQNGELIGSVASPLKDETALATRIFRQLQSAFARQAQ